MCEIFAAHKLTENVYNTISFLVFEVYFLKKNVTCKNVIIKKQIYDFWV